MKSRNDYPKYNQAYEAYILGEYSKFELLRMKTSLSANEKTLLSIRKLIKEKNLDKALNIVNTLTISDNDTFLKAESFLLKAAITSQLGNKQEAYINYSLALRDYSLINDKTGQFSCNYNLSSNANRLGLSKIALFHLEECEQLASTNREISLINRGLACEYSKQNKESLALEYIQKALDVKDALNKNDKEVLLNVASDIYYRFGDKDKATLLLEEIKSSNMNFDAPRILLHYNILKNMDSNNKLGKIPTSVNDDKEFSLKWNLIQSLEEYDFKQARLYWQKLKEVFPQIYGDNFKALNISDQSNVFFKYITKLIDNGKDLKNLDISNLKVNTKSHKLVTTLQDSNNPVSKVDLIELVWAKEYETSDDDKFYQLIRSIKKKTNISIKNKNSSYYIEL